MRLPPAASSLRGALSNAVPPTGGALQDKGKLFTNPKAARFKIL